MTEFPQYRHDWKITSKAYTKVQPSGRKLAIYNAECPYCSKSMELSLTHMKQNQSCGCMRYKLNGRPTHGDSKTRLYKIWLEMKRRCKDTPSSIKKFPYHAGKGITVTPEWEDYSVFKVWAYSNGYEESLSIDRRDGDLNYEPSNCRWVDDFIQSQNQAMNGNNTSGYTGVKVISYNGVRGSTVHYQADITYNGTRVNLGRFDTAEDAVIARNNYVIKNRTNHKIQVINQRI